MNKAAAVTFGLSIIATSQYLAGEWIDADNPDTFNVKAEFTSTASTATRTVAINQGVQDTILGHEYERPAQPQPGQAGLCEPLWCGKGNNLGARRSPSLTTTLYVLRGAYQSTTGEMVVGEVAILANGTVVTAYPS